MENIKLFKKALKFVLKWEGGYGHNPNDKGGATNKGITQYTYNAWLKEHKLQQKNVKHISDAEVEEIYSHLHPFLSSPCQNIFFQRVPSDLFHVHHDFD